MAPKNERSGEYLLSDERVGPGAASQRSQCLPLSQGMQTTHLSHNNVDGNCLILGHFLLTLVVKRKRFFPTLQLLEPGLSKLNAFLIQLSFAKNTNGSIRLLELIVDNDQSLDSTTALILQELEFLVVQSLCVRVTTSSLPTQDSDVDRQSLVVMLHELSEVEQKTQQIRWNVLGLDCALNILDELVLELLI
ncbi:hypothetical protein HG531_005798 [Fusarium graminearum]|nr:hypothetical protein HG531_005798 [Fusarium graminearum]